MLSKLPLDLSTFSALRQANYLYVDKTRYAYELITGLATHASKVVPMEEIVKLISKDEQEISDGLTQYLGQHTELVDPKKIYMLEGSTAFYHVSCLRASDVSSSSSK